MEVLQAADKLPAAEWEVISPIGNATQKQWTSQIQRPEKADKEAAGKQNEGLGLSPKGEMERHQCEKGNTLKGHK